LFVIAAKTLNQLPLTSGPAVWGTTVYKVTPQ